MPNKSIFQKIKSKLNINGYKFIFSINTLYYLFFILILILSAIIAVPVLLSNFWINLITMISCSLLTTFILDGFKLSSGKFVKFLQVSFLSALLLSCY